MREQRLQQVFPAEDLAVMGACSRRSAAHPCCRGRRLSAHECAGIAELLPHLPRLAARLRTATAAVHAWQPHALLTVDYKARAVQCPCAAAAAELTKRTSPLPTPAQGFNLRLQRTVRAGWRPGAPRPAGVCSLKMPG